MVTMENYEEYMILFADGELNADEQKELLAFVQLHPELETELKAYANTKLVPDDAVSFGDKTSLLEIPDSKSQIPNPKLQITDSKSQISNPKSQKSKGGQKGIIISLKQWAVYGAAAGIAALLITVLVKWNGQKQVVVADKKTPVRNEQRIDTIKIKKENAVQEPVLVQQNKPIEKEENKNSKKVVTKKQELRYTNTKQMKKVVEPDQQPKVIKEEITKLNIDPEKKIETNTLQPNTIPMVTVKEQVATPDTKTKKGLLERLPIDEEKKEGLKDLTNTLTNSVQQVKNITNNIKETALVVKLGKKQFKLNF